MDKTICLLDPALDIEAMDNYADWVESRSFEDARFLPGKTPTVFLLGDIPTSEFLRYVETAPTEVEKEIRAFQCGVKIIETPEGKTLLPPGDRFDIEAVMRLTPLVIRDIGRRAYLRAFLGPEIGRRCPLPPGLRDAALMRLLHAAKTAQSQPSEG